MTLKYVELPRHLIKAQHSLEVPIYSQEGMLLADKGTLLSDKQALGMLQYQNLRTLNKELVIALGKVRHAKAVSTDLQPSKSYKIPAAIDRLRKLETALHKVYADPTNDQSILQLNHLISRLQTLCQEAPNLTLAKVLLDEKTHYTIRHSLHTASVCEFIATYLNWNKTDRRSLIGAALSMNISLGFMQDELAAQASPLTGDQRIIIENHSTKSVEMLMSIGIDDPDWLEYVAKHHEQTDGSGYPDELSGDDIPLGAIILNIADIYCAKITGRQYRDPISPDTAARDFYRLKDTHVNGSIIEVFIKVLGLYPPGCIVQLVNKEIGVVVKRGQRLNTPDVRAFLDTKNKLYGTPMLRKTDNKGYAITAILNFKAPPLNHHRDLVWALIK